MITLSAKSNITLTSATSYYPPEAGTVDVSQTLNAKLDKGYRRYVPNCDLGDSLLPDGKFRTKFNFPVEITISGENISMLNFMFSTGTTGPHPANVKLVNILKQSNPKQDVKFTQSVTKTGKSKEDEYGTTYYQFTFRRTISGFREKLKVENLTFTKFYTTYNADGQELIINYEEDYIEWSGYFDTYSSTLAVDFSYSWKEYEIIETHIIDSVRPSISFGHIYNKVVLIFDEVSYGILTFELYRISVPSFNFESRDIISLNSSRPKKNSNQNPDWGLASGKFDLTVSDFNNKFKEYIDNDEFTVPLVVYLNDTLSGKSERSGTFFVTSAEYDKYSKLITFKGETRLIFLQNVKAKAIPLQSAMTYYQLYELLKSKSASLFSFEPLDSETESYLKSNTCLYPYIESGSLWSQWTKFCEMGALQLYVSKNDMLKLSYDLGVNT